MTFRLEDFITAFWGASFEGEVKVWSLKTKRTSSFGPGDIARLVQDVEERKHDEDLYFGLSTQPADLAPAARGTNETAITLPGFFADIDFANSKESQKHYPPDYDTALGLINSFGTKPFLIQHSGNGLHVLYALDKPLVMYNREDRQKAQALSRGFARKIADHFKDAGFEIDNVSDLARIFRVPTTFNLKGNTPKPVSVIAFNPENRVSLADLERTLPPVDSEPSKTAPTSQSNHTLIQRECAWYHHYTGDGAAAADEPNWYATASITARCEDGKQVFHGYVPDIPVTISVRPLRN